MSQSLSIIRSYVIDSVDSYLQHKEAVQWILCRYKQLVFAAATREIPLEKLMYATRKASKPTNRLPSARVPRRRERRSVKRPRRSALLVGYVFSLFVIHIMARFLRVYVSRNCITAQRSECFIPLLPHPFAGQRPVLLSAMHQLFQRGSGH